MYEDEGMRAKCFGVDYMGEMFDNNLKHQQRQERTFIAYMLFYTRRDPRLRTPPKSTVKRRDEECRVQMPLDSVEVCKFSKIS